MFFRCFVWFTGDRCTRWMTQGDGEQRAIELFERNANALMHVGQCKKKKKLENTVNSTETCSRWRSFATHHERGSHHDVTYKRIQCGFVRVRALFLMVAGDDLWLDNVVSLQVVRRCMALVFVEPTTNCVRRWWQQIWIIFFQVS